MDAVTLPKTAMQLAEHPPMYWEARRYCEDHNLPFEDFEKVRVYLAVKEFKLRIEPWTKLAAGVYATLEPPIMDGQGYIHPATTLAQDELLKTLQEGIDFEAERLGLGAPVREPEAKNTPPA